MADYNRRGNNSRDDEFDWDEYERRTSPQSHQEDRAPSRRRAQQNSNTKKKKRVQKDEKNRNKQKNKKIRKRITIAALITCTIALVITAGISIGMYAAVSREIKDMNIQNLALNYSSFIYYQDSDGDVRELQQLQTNSNRIWVDSSQISQYLKDAIVSIEDERFYKHHGIDLKRTMGATIKYVLSKVGIGSADYGGSTITQQVIKNITNEKEQTPARKIKEMMRAMALERQISKDDILTMYLNIVYFSSNCYGVEAASNVYFNKHASELNLQEAASIVGITQYPAEYDPYAHPDKNVERRNVVLAKMLELGKISQDQYDDAVSSKLETDNSFKKSQTQMTSYFVDTVVNDVIADLMNKKGYSEDFATQQVYNGGLKIYSTVDMDIQEIMEDVFTDTSNFPRTGRGGQSAMVVTDPYTGAVKGIIGGLGEKDEIRGWNRATQAKRQPGSALKPLAVYAPAIDTAKITEATRVVDEEITIGSDNWKPKNSYNDFYGEMSVKEAVARSSNIPAVKVLDMIGLNTSFGYLQNKFHISTLSDKDKNYSSLSLGGLTNGATVKEMAAAYGTFANEGKYIAPYTYTQVLDSAGNVILQNGENSSQAISPAAAYITADLLKGVVNSRVGTGRSAALDDIQAYGKTGTTDDNFDKWFVGFTPYYVGAVWYGFDNPSDLADAGVSGNPSVKAWQLVMDKIHSTLPEKTLSKPSNVVEVEICTDSGRLAVSSCDSETMYFVEGTQPKDTCNIHSGGKRSGSSSSGSSSSSSKATAKPSGSPSTPNPNSSSSSSATAAPDRETSGSSSSSSSGANRYDQSSGSYSGGSSSSSGNYSGGVSSGSGASSEGGASGSGASSAESDTSSSESSSSSQNNTSGGVEERNLDDE